MFEIPICPDLETGEARTLCYDSHGYTVVMDGKVVLHHRLEPICYQLGAAERERMALLYGLEEVGEHRMAAWFKRNDRTFRFS
jgi:hypothetical protein